MEVGSRGAAGTANESNPLSFPNFHTSSDMVDGIMGVDSHQPVGMFDDNHISISLRSVSAEYHLALCGSMDGGSSSGGNVNSVVMVSSTVTKF